MDAPARGAGRALFDFVAYLAGKGAERESSMRVRRSLVALSAAAPLALAASGCSDSSAGQVVGTRGAFVRSVVQNPTQGSGHCHSFGPRPVDSVVNNTGVDIWLHKGANCHDPEGLPSFYLPSTQSAKTVGTVGLWRSFSTVGWPPPVPPNVNASDD
jgi:hypothetical protein